MACEREVGLSAKIHAGDMAARDELVQAGVGAWLGLTSPLASGDPIPFRIDT